MRELPREARPGQDEAQVMEPGTFTVRLSQPKPRRHVIARIRYEPGVPDDLAPLECACGWSGRAGQYARHRTEAGQLTLRRANGSRVLVPAR